MGNHFVPVLLNSPPCGSQFHIFRLFPSILR